MFECMHIFCFYIIKMYIGKNAEIIEQIGEYIYIYIYICVCVCVCVCVYISIFLCVHFDFISLA